MGKNAARGKKRVIPTHLLCLEGSGEAPGKRARRQERRNKDKADRALAAEEKPRQQKQWLDQQRKETALPTLGEEKAAARRKGQDDAEAGAEPGKKKQRRLAALAARKSKVEQKKLDATRKQTEAARQALKGKAPAAGGSKLRDAATEMLRGCKEKTPAAQQRLLAAAAERLTADPQGELELFDLFFELHKSGLDARTKQLALLSAVAIFKDLVPAYRIRDKEEGSLAPGKMPSKANVLLTKYELELLLTYRRLLPLLERAMQGRPRVYAPALAALARAAFDFNYSQRLLHLVVINCTNDEDVEVRNILCGGLQELLANDMRLTASREIVLAIGRLAQAAAKAAGNKKILAATIAPPKRLSTELIRSLLAIPIGRAELAELHHDAGVDKLDEEARKGLQEASVTQNVQQLKKAETELLYEVFVVYLRILRQRHLHNKELLKSVLTGLARWGQQVNLELLLEILGELRHTVEEALSQSDGRVSLMGLYCALTLLTGPSQALLADVTWLADAMTKGLGLALPHLHSVYSEAGQWPPAKCFSTSEEGQLFVEEPELALALEADSMPALVLRCLEAALKCPQGYGKSSDAALASLAEQLFNLVSSADAHVALALLRNASQLLKRHHRLHVLLDVEGGLFGLGGVTDRAVSVLWNLQPLAFSLCPELAAVSRQLPTAILQRNALSAELFPMRDSDTWMQAEVTRHLGALATAPAPQPREGPAPKQRLPPPRFLREADVQALA